ncbi:MAG: glutamine amidotransferase [Eubacterium sp.]|nr:glutamine amidotransferase [Eubacterium sp.]MBR2279183.1 glutamine amidotransferase [Eubacterium sp.]
MKTITIAHLYPKEMNLYGDSGNVLCLCYRLNKRGYNTQVIQVGIGNKLGDFDILFIGGGQDREMQIISQDLKRKSDAITYAIQSSKTVLAICGGYQLLGEYYQSADGNVMKLCGALPFYTIGGSVRMIGNTVFDTPFGKVVGFENHSGKTYLDSVLSPLGRVAGGFGNNGEDGGEGLLFNNTFCTYAHGCVLPKNPALADEILRRATGDELAPLDDEAELRCHNLLIKRFT